MSSARRLRTSSAAQRDLDDIFDFIAADRGVTYAVRAMERLNASFDYLMTFPRAGALRDEFAEPMRVHVVWPWLVLYDADLMSDGILIVRVIDGRRDLGTLTIN